VNTLEYVLNDVDALGQIVLELGEALIDKELVRLSWVVAV
jgi:hypothetical protein